MTVQVAPVMRLLLLLLLVSTASASVQIYQDGALVLECFPPSQSAPPPPPPSPSPTTTLGTITYGHTGNSDAQPIDGQPLYSQALLAPGVVFFEFTHTAPFHHMEWYDNGVKIRRENYAPYTTQHTLTVGTHRISAVIYSTETDVLGFHEVDIYVGDGGAAIPPPDTPVATVDFEWIPPAVRENGEYMSPEEIALYYLTVSGTSYTVPGTQTTFTIQLPAGYYIATVSVEDTDGLQSLPSDPVEFTL